jgi:hypothetical protein
MVHADYESCHKASASHEFLAKDGIEIAAHPPHSPRLALSDFYPFGDAKDLLMGESVETGGDLYWQSGGFWRPFKSRP